MIRKYLLLASYVLSTAAIFLAAFSLFSLLSLKSDLLEIVHISDYQIFIDFDNVLRDKYLMFGGFAFTSLTAIVCLLVIVIGKSELVHFIYIEKQKPDWASENQLSGSIPTETAEKEVLVQRLLDIIHSNSQGKSTLNSACNEEAIFKAICEVTNVSAGICYLPDQEFLNYRQAYTFAVKVSDITNQVYHLKQGLIGQAASDLQFKEFKSVPTNYLNIESGIGALIPSTLLIFPFFSPVTNNCLMVVELAYFSDLNPAVISALKEINLQITSNLVPLEAQG